MELPGLTQQAQDYRYGFNGKENDREWGAGGLTQDYGFRLYNPALAKFLSVDPLGSEYPYYTPYQFAGNTPIKFIDLDGLEPMSNPGDAQNVIDDNRGRLNDRHGIDGENFLDNLSNNVANSESIHQGKGTNFCGPACFSSQTFVKNDPVGYVNVMLDLYNYGSANYFNGKESVELTISESTLANLNGVANEGLAGNPADKMLLFSLSESFANYLNYVGRALPFKQAQEDIDVGTTMGKFENMLGSFGYNFESIGGNTVFDQPTSGEALKFSTEQIVGNKSVVLFVSGPVLRRAEESSVMGTHYISLKSIHTSGNLVQIKYWDYGQTAGYKEEEYTQEEFDNLVFGAVSIQNPK